MALPSVDVNWAAIFVATIASYVIGMLWYSPVLFGKQWMQAIGFSKKDMAAGKKNMSRSMILGFVTTLIMVYVLAHIIGMFGASGAMEGMQTAFWVWLGFFATSLMGSVLWEQKPLSLYFINASHYLVTLGVMGLILAAW